MALSMNFFLTVKISKGLEMAKKNMKTSLKVEVLINLYRKEERGMHIR